jgi:hypothetical protein
MTQYRGFVSKLVTRNSEPGAKRRWTAYSFRVEKEDGTEYEEWFSYGFEAPPFQEGAFIEFEAQKDDRGYLKYVQGTGKQIKNPPARAAAKRSGVVGNGVESLPQSATAPVAKDSSASNDRQTSIVLQHSQEMALRAVAILLEHDGLPMSTAKTAAGTAKRFAEINAMIDKLTRRFYDDTNSDRILTLVASTVVEAETPDPLPAVATEKPKAAAPKAAPASTSTEGVF